jgi:hypothetical protein
MPPSAKTFVAAPRPPTAPRPSRLLAGIYHDIGMAAVAAGLKIDLSGIDADALQSVQRGTRYIHLMPTREGAVRPAAG